MITINVMTVYSFFVSFTDEFPSIAGSYCNVHDDDDYSYTIGGLPTLVDNNYR